MQKQNSPLIKHRSAYDYGYNAIVDASWQTAMNFGVLRLKQGQIYEIGSGLERAFLLMSGHVIFSVDRLEYDAFRSSYFNENPMVLHLSAVDSAVIRAKTDCELMVMETENDRRFSPLVFDQTNMLESERRGKGLLDDVSYRIVRTVFDKRNRPESNLVVGEIITFSGHWSSCPPHYHRQPEIYYYRFSEPQGFGIGEDGEDIKRIEHNDTMVIVDEKTHAHSTAPGYALYTLWFIRHLPDDPYHMPSFKFEHDWTRHLEANRRVWRPLEDIK
ncbi:MAG: 5-deoxy-glucuronate isomerase [Francisellaceae bacterium]